MAADALAAALPPCSALRPVTELGCWLSRPGLEHHRIQRLPGINIPVKHFQDSPFQVLLSSCCRTRWRRDRISKSLWQGLFNKSILAQRQHCPCRVVVLCACVHACVRVPALVEHVCMALGRRPVHACCAGAAGCPAAPRGRASAVCWAVSTLLDKLRMAAQLLSPHKHEEAAESTGTLPAGPGRGMRPDPNRLLAGGLLCSLGR